MYIRRSGRVFAQTMNTRHKNVHNLWNISGSERLLTASFPSENWVALGISIGMSHTLIKIFGNFV
jgi:hypothetical protein